LIPLAQKKSDDSFVGADNLDADTFRLKSVSACSENSNSESPIKDSHVFWRLPDVPEEKGIRDDSKVTE
jgi:hypothetical protein